MNKLFGLFLLALAFLTPDLAQAANRWAVCATTCTWNNDGITTGIMWSSVGSGGATGAAAPTSADDVILDAATCVGGTTCTITTLSGTISANSITWGACTASTTGCVIAANTNNTNFTLSGAGGTTPFSGSGSGTRKWTGGTGTYALSYTGGNTVFTMATTTNDQGSTFNGATWTVSGSTANARSWNGGGFSFGATTFNTNASSGSMLIIGANTWASLTIGAPHAVQFGNSTTQTITGALSITGGSSSAITLIQSNSPDTAATLSIGSASSGSWATLRAITTSGAAALTLTNSLDAGRNTLANGGSITPPSTGGGGGRIIGG